MRTETNGESTPIVTSQVEEVKLEDEFSCCQKVSSYGRDYMDWSHLLSFIGTAGGIASFVVGKYLSNEAASITGIAVTVATVGFNCIRISFLKGGSRKEIRVVKGENNRFKVQIEDEKLKIKNLEIEKTNLEKQVETLKSESSRNELEEKVKKLNKKNQKLGEQLTQLKNAQEDAIKKITDSRKKDQDKLRTLKPLLEDKRVKELLKTVQREQKRSLTESQDLTSSGYASGGYTAETDTDTESDTSAQQ